MHKIKSPTANQQLCAVTLLGNLVADPDIRYRANPVSAITEITLATSAKWLDKKTNTFKEWTSYHNVRVEGDLVEQTLLNAKKGEIILVHGYLSHIKSGGDTKNTALSIVHASFIQKFNKGYTQTINQILCSAQLSSVPKLITTQNNKNLAQVTIIINQQDYSVDKQCWLSHQVAIELQVWGKQAQYLVDNAKVNDSVMVEGKLSYLATADKKQFIEAKTVHLLS
ncbi:single-stranded DNA-binding protein [Colwellia sp. 6_MG-2023]|uniref:single-stranded DNA-binding protein n=1 Tax=Colwellia sp. 6_MG-2023 TaxID=3062676 RepID=UPI0026E1BC6D|nr:single-stranded DNA-binding protein [Colwellia sp. 6_MG-2023]MDO6486372.1 single-stranded DNA-binding protein [Colwellia sp. 6_MG-2023]